MVVSQASSSSSPPAAAEVALEAADVTFTGADVTAGTEDVAFEEGVKAPVPVLAAAEPLPSMH